MNTALTILLLALAASAYPCCKYEDGKFKRGIPAQVILYRTVASSEINNGQQKCNHHLCKEHHLPEPYKYALHNRANRRHGEWIERPERRNYHYRPPLPDQKDTSNFEPQFSGAHRFSPPTAVHHLHTHHHHYDFPSQQKRYNQKVGNNYDPHLMQLYLEVLETYRNKDKRPDPADVRAGSPQGLYGGTASVNSRTRLSYTHERSPFRSSPPFHRFSEPDPLYHPNRSILFTYPTTSALTTARSTTPVFPDSINAQLPPLEHSTDTTIPYVSATMVTERTSLLQRVQSTSEMQPEVSEKPLAQDDVYKVSDKATTNLSVETTKIMTESSLSHDNSNVTGMNGNDASLETQDNKIVDNTTVETDLVLINNSSEVALSPVTTEGNTVYTNSSMNDMVMHTTTSTNTNLKEEPEDDDSILITVGSNLMTDTQQNQQLHNETVSISNSKSLNDTEINAAMVTTESSINMPDVLNKMTQQSHIQTIFIAPQHPDIELFYSNTTITPAINVTETTSDSRNNNEDKTEATHHEEQSESKMTKFIQSLINHARTHSIINETEIN